MFTERRWLFEWAIDAEECWVFIFEKSRTMLIFVVILEGGGSGRRGQYVQVGRDALHL
jgi:hypothetical protein